MSLSPGEEKIWEESMTSFAGDLDPIEQAAGDFRMRRAAAKILVYQPLGISIDSAKVYEQVGGEYGLESGEVSAALSIARDRLEVQR